MDQLIPLLTRYGYFMLLPLAVVEGPILSVIAGLLCALHILNPVVVVPVIVTGDVIGDSFYYELGRWRSRQRVPRALRPFIPSPRKVERVRQYVHTNLVRTIFLAKVIPGVGLAGLYLAGNAKILYKKFLLSCLGVSFIQCSGYVLVGFLFGTAYRRIESLLNGLASVTILAAGAAAAFFIIRSMRQKL